MKAKLSQATGSLLGSVAFHLCLLLACLALSCRPVKQIQRQDAAIDQLKAKWIGDWVMSHPCPQLPEINLDSLCRVVYGIRDFDFNMAIDSGRQDSAGRVFHDTIRRDVSGPPKRILVPYEDKRTISLLYDSLRSKEKQIAGLQGGRDVKGQDCASEVAAARKEKTKWIWLFIAACAVIAGGGTWTIFKLFH
jgi:hypothetical protein